MTIEIISYIKVFGPPDELNHFINYHKNENKNVKYWCCKNFLQSKNKSKNKNNSLDSKEFSVESYGGIIDYSDNKNKNELKLIVRDGYLDKNLLLLSNYYKNLYIYSFYFDEYLEQCYNWTFIKNGIIYAEEYLSFIKIEDNYRTDYSYVSNIFTFRNSFDKNKFIKILKESNDFKIEHLENEDKKIMFNTIDKPPIEWFGSIMNRFSNITYVYNTEYYNFYGYLIKINDIEVANEFISFTFDDNSGLIKAFEYSTVHDFLISNGAYNPF